SFGVHPVAVVRRLPSAQGMRGRRVWSPEFLERCRSREGFSQPYCALPSGALPNLDNSSLQEPVTIMSVALPRPRGTRGNRIAFAHCRSCAVGSRWPVPLYPLPQISCGIRVRQRTPSGSPAPETCPRVSSAAFLSEDVVDDLPSGDKLARFRARHHGT